MVENLLEAVKLIFTFESLILIFLGSAIGIVIGALPGLGPSVGLALMLPLTIGMTPTSAIVLLVAIYMTAEYGGSITAILIGTPGTSAATATVLDGYALTKKGQPGKALGASLTASTIGGMFTTLVLLFLTMPLMTMALKFGPAEYFALGIFGLSLVASLSGESMLKGLLMALVGLVIATIGLDPLTGTARFTFGSYNLYDGIPLIAALVGLYAISEVFIMLVQKEKKLDAKISKKEVSNFISFKEFKMTFPVMLQGSVIGSIIGVIPGAGGSIAAWVSYQQSKRIAKDKDEYGKGALSGIAAPESSNNATVGGALIPLLSLGIPGSPTAAILLGAFMLHGLSPGVDLMETNGHVFYGLVIGLFITCIIMFIIGYSLTKVWVKIINVPTAYIAPIVLGISIIGVYSIRNMMFDVYLALILGVVGFFLRRYGFPLAPIVLALVLGNMIESNFRRALLISEGDWMIFIQKPISLVLILIALITFVVPMIQSMRKKKLLDKLQN